MAPPIPKTFINDLLNQCDIITLIRRFIPLDAQGKGRCPFHEDNTPSFTVSTSKQLYHCFGCGAAGNAINFIRTYEKLDFVSAVEWLANYLQLKIPRKTSHHAEPAHGIKALYKALEDAAHFYQEQLAQSSLALEYLRKRGLTTASIQKFQLGFAPAHWDSLLKFLIHQKKHTALTLQAAGLVVQKDQSHYYDRFRSRVIFPIRDQQGRYIGLGGRILEDAHEPKYLNSPETLLFHKNQALYGLYEATIDRKSRQYFWVVEGYLDVIMLHQFGINQTVATLGTATSRFHLQQLFRLTKEVVFCFDGDAAGKKAAIRALEISLSIAQDDWSIRFFLLPSGEDPDSWIQKSPVDTREKLFLHTITLEDFLFQFIQEDISIDTTEGQRVLLQKATPLLHRIPHGIRREQIFQRLARLVNIEADKLQHLTTHIQSFERAAILPKEKAYTVLDRAIGLLLQYPKKLSSHLPTLLNSRLKAEYPLLDTLINKVREDPNMHTAILLEQFRENTTLQHLMKLAQYDWLIPSDGVVAEFQDILVHLDKLIRDQKIKAFIHKARQHSITQAEEYELTQLLNERE